MQQPQPFVVTPETLYDLDTLVTGVATLSAQSAYIIWQNQQNQLTLAAIAVATDAKVPA